MADEVIIQNLKVLYYNSSGDILITGSLLHDINTIDAGIIAALKISSSIKPRFLGIEGLKRIIEKTSGKLTASKRQSEIHDFRLAKRDD